MIYYFYELHPIITSEGVVFKNLNKSPRIVYTLDIPDDEDFISYMKKYLYDDLIFKDDFYDSFALDEKYYIISNEGFHCYVFSMHKGYCFYDGAEHDERVEMAAELELDPDKMYI